MSEPSDRPLDLHRLRQFLSVATNSGFTRAAAELHLTQQALSTSVRQLERQVGASLFDRSGRHVTLTPAGRVLHDGAPALLAASSALVRKTFDASRGVARPFIVGRTPAITSDEVFELIEPVRKRLPDTSFTAVALFPHQLSTALYDGSVDMVLRRGVVTPRDLAAAVIAYHPVRVAVARGHELAQRDSVSIRELRHERVVVWAPPGESFYTDFILGTCRRAGFEPEFVVNPIQGTPPVTAAVDGGVAFVTAPAGAALGGRVIVVDLDDAPLAPTQALWLPHTASAVRDAFISIHNQ